MTKHVTCGAFASSLLVAACASSTPLDDAHHTTTGDERAHRDEGLGSNDGSDHGSYVACATSADCTDGAECICLPSGRPGPDGRATCGMRVCDDPQRPACAMP